MEEGEAEGWGWGLGLTLSGHHPLRVPLGQHPHVTIETGLLHWGGMKNRFSNARKSTSDLLISVCHRHQQDFDCLENSPLKRQ